MAFWKNIFFGIKEDNIASKRDFYSMIDSNRRKVVDGKSNCIGTALYLVGEKDKDEYLWKGSQSFFNQLTESNDPELGYLMGWPNASKEIIHAAVITGINPLTIAVRDKAGGAFYPDQKFENINKAYSGREVKYFIPSKLQKIIDKEALN